MALIVAPVNEVVDDGLVNKVVHVERVEAPVDRVPIGERFVHRDERSVLFICNPFIINSEIINYYIIVQPLYHLHN